jgi:SAM-dependent methyltransferase
MRHKVKSSVIEPSWFEDVIFKTLDMYEKGQDLENSPLSEFQRNCETWGGQHMSLSEVTEPAIKKRVEEFIGIYRDIKENGYKSIAPLFVWFDDNGFIRIYDGHHRISILRYLKIDPEVEITTDWDSTGIDPTAIKGRDFPLVKMASSIWGVKRLYHYVNDPLGRLKDFSIQRPDREGRRNYLLNSLVGESVLDIGCSEGYLSHEVAKEGYQVTGLERGYITNQDERGKKLLGIARYLATLQSLKIDFILADWKDYVGKQNVFFDNIFYLSVLHSEINELGEKAAFENLTLFRGKCRQFFIEIPDVLQQPDWGFAFKIDELIPKLERTLKLKFQEVWSGYRPILLFVKPL